MILYNLRYPDYYKGSFFERGRHMKNARHFGWFLLFLLASGEGLFARETCIGCHTNESAMKALFTAPAHTGGEEGEG